MDLDRLGMGDRIAGGSAIVLLLVMFIFGWFTIDGASIETDGAPSLDISQDQIEASGEDASGNAWQSFSIIDLILFLAIAAAIGVVAMRATGNAVPAEAGTLVLGLGALATLLVLFRIISPPDLVPGSVPDGVDVETEVGRGIGVFIGLIASAGIAYGGMLLSNDSGATTTRSTAAAPPPPAGPPA